MMAGTNQTSEGEMGVAALRSNRGVATFTRAPARPASRTELEECYTRIVEFADAVKAFRALSNREADFLAVALDNLGEAHAERRPVPDDFDIVFVEQGRPACETWYRASRITVNRWLMQRGKRRLIDERAAFVKHQRGLAHESKVEGQTQQSGFDTYLPVARMAAAHIQVSRYGGWPVSQCKDDRGGWIVGTVHKTSEELIAMAERQGFDRQAAVTEARQEGY